MGPARSISNLSINNSFEYSENLAFAGEREHATKASATRILCSANACKLLQYLVGFFLVGRVHSRIARRVDARRAAKSLDLEPGIIGNDKTGHALGNCHGFKNRVLLKSCSTLRNVRNFRMRSQISHVELRPENPLDFFSLMRIARCNQKVNHHVNEIWKQGIQE